MTRSLLPPLLAELGVHRKVAPPAADIQTLRLPALYGYPVIETYHEFCDRTGLPRYGGGNREKQANAPGRITSGYRTETIGHNRYSEHRHGTALDTATGDIQEQLRIAPTALELYPRVGFYPYRKFTHLGLMPDEWSDYHGKAKYWIMGNWGYLYRGNDPDAVLEFLKKIAKG